MPCCFKLFKHQKNTSEGVSKKRENETEQSEPYRNTLDDFEGFDHVNRQYLTYEQLVDLEWREESFHRWN